VVYGAESGLCAFDSRCRSGVPAVREKMSAGWRVNVVAPVIGKTGIEGTEASGIAHYQLPPVREWQTGLRAGINQLIHGASGTRVWPRWDANPVAIQGCCLVCFSKANPNPVSERSRVAPPDPNGHARR